MLEPVVGEAQGEVYLPPTPLRRGGGHRRAPESSEGARLKGKAPLEGVV